AYHSGAGAATLTGSMEGECHGRYQPWTRICAGGCAGLGAGGKYVHHVAGRTRSSIALSASVAPMTASTSD
ncbi:MAG TPA: hypothetical protein VN888_15045, partial [Mycobacterium sp.]|nr:hypothetical protein [Mycobacterium sp.]